VDATSEGAGRRKSLADKDSSTSPLDALEKRLEKARTQSSQHNPKEGGGSSKLGIAFRLSTELVAAVVVGGGIGWGLDRLFGTSPFLLVVMFFLGIVAGFLNVVRAARELNDGMDQDGQE
jgi:ATP synthase protein I